MGMTTEVVDTRYGPMTIFSDDIGVSKMVKEYGEYSPAEVALLGLLINKQSVVVDAGANIGSLTLPFSELAGHVYAFEPQEMVFNVLTKNIGTRENVTAFQCGLGEHEGTYRVGPSTSNWGPNSPGSFQLEKDRGEEEVQVKRLDDFNLPGCDLLKLDVEGMELHILGGAQETIKKYRPYIWMERSYDHETLKKVCIILRYRYSTVDLPFYYPNNWRGSKVNIYPELAHMSVLMQPVNG